MRCDVTDFPPFFAAEGLYSGGILRNVMICIMINYPYVMIHPLMHLPAWFILTLWSVRAPNEGKYRCSRSHYQYPWHDFLFFLKTGLIPLFSPLLLNFLKINVFRPEIRRLPRRTLQPSPSFSACLHRIRFFFKFCPVTHARTHPNYVSVVAERVGPVSALWDQVSPRITLSSRPCK